MGTVVPFRGPKKQQKHGHRARDRQVQVQSLVPRAHGRARAHGRRRAAIVLYRFTQKAERYIDGLHLVLHESHGTAVFSRRLTDKQDSRQLLLNKSEK